MLNRYTERLLRKHTFAASSFIPRVFPSWKSDNDEGNNDEASRKGWLPGSFQDVGEDLASSEVPEDPEDQRQDKENRNVNRATRRHASSRADVRPCGLFLSRSLDPPPPQESLSARTFSNVFPKTDSKVLESIRSQQVQFLESSRLASSFRHASALFSREIVPSSNCAPTRFLNLQKQSSSKVDCVPKKWTALNHESGNTICNATSTTKLSFRRFHTDSQACLSETYNVFCSESRRPRFQPDVQETELWRSTDAEDSRDENLGEASFS